MTVKKFFSTSPLLGIYLLLTPWVAQADIPLTLNWEDLMPEEELAVLLSLPMLKHDYSEDAADPFTDEWDDPYADVWNTILTSTNVRAEYEGRLIRLPGFLVPLDIDDKQQIVNFFLVPYFGACIHVPPPPPNQLIYAQNLSEIAHITVDQMYSAFWVTGILRLEEKQHELGHAAYYFELRDVQPYRWSDYIE